MASAREDLLRVQRAGVGACPSIFSRGTDDKDVCPPQEFFTNDNMSDFFVELFTKRGKPSVQQARKWLNHCLAQYHKPPMNKMHYQHYASVLDVLRGMTKEEKWKSHLLDEWTTPTSVHKEKSVEMQNLTNEFHKQNMTNEPTPRITHISCTPCRIYGNGACMVINWQKPLHYCNCRNSVREQMRNMNVRRTRCARV